MSPLPRDGVLDHSLEVRRYFPFFPFAVARTRESFTWDGTAVPRGRRVLLDLYGTNHDARHWTDPDAFRPSRFVGRAPGAYELVPQGGGSHDVQHRCAGEWLSLDWLSLDVMKVAVRFLTRELRYDVPEQDLTVPLNQIPTAPRSGFVISSVTATATPG